MCQNQVRFCKDADLQRGASSHSTVVYKKILNYMKHRTRIGQDVSYMTEKGWECMTTKPLLEVEGLKKYFPVKKGVLGRTVGHVKAVDDVSFYVNEGETL